MELTKKDKLIFLMGKMRQVNISKEDIIGMLSMLKTEEMIDEMIYYLVNNPDLTEEKVVKALIIVVREAEENKATK